MRNLELTIVSFKRSDDQQEHLYALNYDRLPEIGEYYFRDTNSRFTQIQHNLFKGQIESNGGSAPVIEATTDESYDLPRIPQAFVTNYFLNNREPKKIQLRLPDLITEKV